MSVLGDAALRYAVELGWAVFPLKPRAKTPITHDGFKSATTNAEQIARWWEETPDANIGLACGAVSGVVVVDVDGPAGDAALERMGGIPETVEQRTGKGRHLLFAHPGVEVRNSAKKMAEEVDVCGDGGYIVVAPSVHPDGHVYRWADYADPFVRSVPALPPAWLNAMQAGPAPDRTPTPRQEAETMAGDVIGSGGRNDTLTRIAGRLFARGLTFAEVESLVLGLNATRCRPPLDDAEVRAVVRSVGQSESRNHGNRADAPVEPASFLPLDAQFFAELVAQYDGPIAAIPTPWETWNRACRGFGGGVGVAKGWHTVIAGPSNSGKSLLALNMALHAIRTGAAVAYISLEMSAQQLAARALAIWSGHAARVFEPGSYFQRPTYDAVVRDLTQAPARLEIVNRPDNRLASVVATLEDAASRGAELVVVDYMQLIAVPGVDSISDRMFQISQGIQRFAYRTGVRTVALSQLNRATSFGARKESPVVEGLQGSSALENDADQVVLIDRSNQREEDTMRYNRLLLAKNRHGPQVQWEVAWDSKSLQVRERG